MPVRVWLAALDFFCYMDIKITDIKKKYYVDEQGLCYDLLVNAVVKPNVDIKHIDVDITINSSEIKWD